MIQTEIICPKLNDANSLQAFFGQLNLIPDYSEKVSLNFQKVDFITPSGALGLTLFTQELYRRGKVIMLSEVNSAVLAYLDRIDYFETFPDKIVLSRHNAPFQNLGRSKASHNLLELTLIPCDELTNAYTQALFLPRTEAVLMHSFAQQANSVGKILTMISEITGNIIHSKDQGFCTMQTYAKDGRVRIHIAIGDLGMGIRQSLLEYHDLQFPEEVDFIIHALQLGTSSKEGIRGLGLARVYNSIKELSGAFLIRSGTAGVVLKGGVMKFHKNLPFVPGTQVEMFIRQ